MRRLSRMSWESVPVMYGFGDASGAEQVEFMGFIVAAEYEKPARLKKLSTGGAYVK